MKTNSLILGAAVLMLATACSNDEVVKVAENSAAIGFNSFVNNSTRTDYGTTMDETLDALKVYGVTKNSSIDAFVVFNGDVVTNDGSAWTYSPLRYWIAGNDYTFAAVAPASAIVNAPAEGEVLSAGNAVVNQGTDMSYGGITTIEFNNNGDVDLLYYSPANKSNVSASEQTVQLNLGHLLSRVRFQFVNATGSNAYAIKVKNVNIKQAIKNATYNVGASSWNVGGSEDFVFNTEDEYTANAGSAISESQNLIPEGVKEYNATFTIELYQITGTNYTKVGTYNHDITLPEVNYEAGKSYTLNANVNMKNVNPDEQIEPIKFNATVTDWAEQTQNEVTLPEHEVTND